MPENLLKCPIAKPFSESVEKLTPKIYSLIRKCDHALKSENTGGKRKVGVLKGIKEVTKRLRQFQTKRDGSLDGCLVVLGADTSPFDVLSHIPKMAEEAEVAYIWVPSRKDLGFASGSRRPTSVVLLERRDDYAHSLGKCVRMAEKLAIA